MRGAFAAAGLRQPDYRVAGRRGRRAARRRGRSSLRGQGGFAVGEPRRDPRRRSAGGRRGGRAGQGDPRRGRRGPGRAAAGRALRPGRRGGRRGPLRGGALEILAVFDKPDPLGEPLLRGDHLRDPVAPARRDPRGRQPADGRGGRRARPGRGTDTRRAADRRESRVDARARRPLDRRAVLALAALRDGREPRGAHPAPRPRAAARRPGPRGRLRGDDAPDPEGGRAEGARAGRGTGGARRDRARDLDRARQGGAGAARGRHLGFLFARGETPEQVERRCAPPTAGSRS